MKLPAKAAGCQNGYQIRFMSLRLVIFGQAENGLGEYSGIQAGREEEGHPDKHKSI